MALRIEPVDSFAGKLVANLDIPVFAWVIE